MVEFYSSKKYPNKKMKVPDNFILEINIHTKVTESGFKYPIPATLSRANAQDFGKG